MQDNGLPKIIPISINCADFEERVSDYIDGSLNTEDRATCDVHVKCCKDCQGLLHDIESIIRVAKTLGESPIPEGVRYRFRAALKQALELRIEEPSNSG